MTMEDKLKKKWIEVGGIWKYVNGHGYVFATLEDLSPKYKETFEINVSSVATLIGVGLDDAKYRAEEVISAFSEAIKKSKPQRMCPECHKIHGEKQPGDCDMTYGRRGWRQLGVYDG